jgi:hypothetical protein
VLRRFLLHHNVPKVRQSSLPALVSCSSGLSDSDACPPKCAEFPIEYSPRDHCQLDQCWFIQLGKQWGRPGRCQVSCGQSLLLWLYCEPSVDPFRVCNMTYILPRALVVRSPRQIRRPLETLRTSKTTTMRLRSAEDVLFVQDIAVREALVSPQVARDSWSRETSRGFWVQ